MVSVVIGAGLLSEVSPAFFLPFFFFLRFFFFFSPSWACSSATASSLAFSA
jgi:hypothetical protein